MKTISLIIIPFLYVSCSYSLPYKKEDIPRPSTIRMAMHWIIENASFTAKNNHQYEKTLRPSYKFVQKNNKPLLEASTIVHRTH